MKMDWKKLLSAERYEHPETNSEDIRSQFQKDIDRIIFSSQFRRLGRKTQVHPLNENDHIHTRLSHSLETASVGRSLGQHVGDFLLKEHKDEIPKHYTPEHVGQIVQAACLAHDIGNPPFGHAGEGAIRSWFEQKKYEYENDPTIKILERFIPKGIDKDKILNEVIENKANLDGFSALISKDHSTDFLKFDGNAMAFRVMTKTGFDCGTKGMGPTYAVLGALLKYPFLSTSTCDNKFSSFYAERDVLKNCGKKLGLILKDRDAGCGYHRHPLAFLTEAADDICYRVMDIEDGIELKLLEEKHKNRYYNLVKKHHNVGSKFDELPERARKNIARAKIIQKIIYELVGMFKSNYNDIMTGKFHGSLMKKASEDTSCNELYAIYKDISESLFFSKRKATLEIGAKMTIARLLNTFLAVINDICNNKDSFSKKQISAFIGYEHLSELTKAGDCPYKALLKGLDYITGMTDHYAVTLSRRFAGLGEI